MISWSRATGGGPSSAQRAFCRCRCIASSCLIVRGRRPGDGGGLTGLPASFACEGGDADDDDGNDDDDDDDDRGTNDDDGDGDDDDGHDDDNDDPPCSRVPAKRGSMQRGDQDVDEDFAGGSVCSEETCSRPCCFCCGALVVAVGSKS